MPVTRWPQQRSVCSRTGTSTNNERSKYMLMMMSREECNVQVRVQYAQVFCDLLQPARRELQLSPSLFKITVLVRVRVRVAIQSYNTTSFSKSSVLKNLKDHLPGLIYTTLRELYTVREQGNVLARKRRHSFAASHRKFR